MAIEALTEASTEVLVIEASLALALTQALGIEASTEALVIEASLALALTQALGIEASTEALA